MKRRNNTLLKNTFLYFANAIVAAILGVCINKIFALFIDPYEYGIYSVSFSLFSVLSAIVYTVFMNSTLRYYQEHANNNSLSVFYAANIKLLFFAGVFYLVFCAIAIPFVFSFVPNEIYRTLILLFFVLFIPEVLKQISSAFARCQDKPSRQLLSNIAEHLVKLTVFLFSFFFISKTVYSVVYGAIAGALVGVSLYFDCWTIPQRIFKIETKAITKKILSFGLPLIGVPIVNYLLSTSDQLIIKFFCGEYDAGLYSMGYRISSSLFSLVTAFLITASHHKIMEKYDLGGEKIARPFLMKLSLLYWIICLPCVVEVLFFDHYIIEILASKSYSDSSFVLSVSSIGIVFCGFISYVNKAWEVQKKSWMIMIFSGIGAVVNVGLNLVFVPIYGYKAAAVTTIISYLVVISLSSIFGRKILSASLGVIQVIKLIVGVLLLSCVLFAFDRFFIKSTLLFVVLAIMGFAIYSSYIYLIFNREIKEIIVSFKKE